MTVSDDHTALESLDADLASDRAAVISMVALFEDILGDAIRNHLVALSKTQDDDLFGDRGPLATFASKIDFGYALGLYGKETKAKLDLIRKIRNVFAHLHGTNTFDHKDVRRLCNNLPPTADESTHLRSRFNAALVTIAFRLDKHLRVAQRPESPPADLP